MKKGPPFGRPHEGYSPSIRTGRFRLKCGITGAGRPVAADPDCAAVAADQVSGSAAGLGSAGSAVGSVAAGPGSAAVVQGTVGSDHSVRVDSLQ
jgi:hypothetical protein